MTGIGEWIASQFQVLLDWWNGEFLPAWNYLWTNVQMYWEQVGKPVFDKIMQFWDGFAEYWNGIWSVTPGTPSGASWGTSSPSA